MYFFNKMRQVSERAKKAIKAFWIIFGIGILSIILMFILINLGVIGHLPPIEELQNPKNKFASEVYSADGEVLGRFFESKENRVYLPYKEISPNIVHALVATEDVRFFDHSGIDERSMARVIFKTLLLHHGSSGGGSTITQQLAKILYTRTAPDIIHRAMQKPSEWVIAVKLEKLYTKEEILSMYLNKFDFLNNAVGIKSASSIYFGKTPSELSIGESALLVGMLKNPSYFNPVKKKNYDRCKGRRDVVIDQMVKAGYLSDKQGDSVKSTPLVLHYTSVDHKQGLAPYFREYLRRIMTAEEPHREDYADIAQFRSDSIAWKKDPLYGWCNKNHKPDGSKYDLYTDGLKIYTTIDSRMQQYAESSVCEYLGKTLQPTFDKEKKGRPRAPFSNNTRQGQIDTIMQRAIKLSDRYRNMVQSGANETEIENAFNTKCDMDVFTWSREKIHGKDTVYASTKDTVMTPLDSIRYCKSFLRCGMMSIDPFNGHVLAYVGGPDFEHFQYDMATMGRRQVGSTIKPYLYALAMESGMTPCDLAPDIQPKLVLEDGSIWAPKNVPYGAQGKAEIGSMITLKRGLQTSNNWISAYLIKQLQPSNFVRLLKAFGIKSQLSPIYSLCLGVADISIEEMVTAYTAFANKGIETEPIFVTRIEDNNGNVISNFTPRMNEVISEETSYKMIDLLRGVIDGGTGLRLRTRRYPYFVDWQTPVAGKTGTTQNNSDGWFMGFVPNLITGVWVGGEDRDVHFDDIRNGQGSSTALPIWGLYMNRVFNDKKLNKTYSRGAQFNIPAGFQPCSGSGNGTTDAAAEEKAAEQEEKANEEEGLELPD